MQIQTPGMLAPTSASTALSEKPHSTSTDSNTVVARSRMPSSKFYEKLFEYLSNVVPRPSLPSKLETQHVQNISFHGIDFSDGKSTFALPNERLIDSIEMTNCKKFRLADLSVKHLKLQDCTGVFFNSTAHATETLTVVAVGFNIFPCKSLSKTLKKLHLGKTQVNNLSLPFQLEMFVADHLRCGSIQIGTKSYASKINTRQLAHQVVTWKKGENAKGLRVCLEKLGCDTNKKT